MYQSCLSCPNNCMVCSIQYYWYPYSSICTICVSGYALNSLNGNCSEIMNNSMCSSKCSSCIITNSSTNCILCLPGNTLINGQCVLCTVGCSICSSQINVCLACSVGNYLNPVNGTCLSCSPNCINCNSISCTDCMPNYILTAYLTCELACSYPCSTCTSGNPNACLICYAGFTYDSSTKSCLPDFSCNTYFNCSICPFGSILVSLSCYGNKPCYMC